MPPTKKGRGPYKKGSPNKAAHKPIKDRRNPSVIVRMLKSIRIGFGDESHALVRFAEELSKLNTRYNVGKKIDKSLVAKYEADAAHIPYWLLELYAKYLDVPTAIILLITRISSEIEHGEPMKARGIIERIQRVCEIYLRQESDFVKGEGGGKDFAEDKQRALLWVYESDLNRPVDQVQLDLQLQFPFAHRDTRQLRLDLDGEAKAQIEPHGS